jgi:exo-beta-1,3-glucanase (GH17 family)
MIIMERILSSSGLCKALQYTEPNFLDQPDVVDPSDLIMEKIFPYLRVPGTEEEASTYILLQFRNYRPTKKKGG